MQGIFFAGLKSRFAQGGREERAGGAPEGGDLLQVHLGLERLLLERHLQSRRLGLLGLERRQDLSHFEAGRATAGTDAARGDILQRLLARLELVELEQLRLELRLHARALLLPERVAHGGEHGKLGVFGHDDGTADAACDDGLLHRCNDREEGRRGREDEGKHHGGLSQSS